MMRLTHVFAVLVVLICLGTYAHAYAHGQTYFVPKPLKPFSPDTNYMSVPGYLRWRNYLTSGNWKCRGMVKFGQLYVDNQDAGEDGASGMDIKSVTPHTVQYTLRVNDDSAQDVPYEAHVVHPKGIFGDAIRIELAPAFCIGPDYRYELTFSVAPNGLLDKVGNGFGPADKNRRWKSRFHLDYGQDGNLVAIEEVTGKQILIPYGQGFFYLAALAPHSKK